MLTPDNVKAEALLDEPYRYVTVDGLSIAYRDYGEGPALLLLHGWPLHGDTFALLADVLSKRFRCIIPDLPGAGMTRWSARHDLSPVGQALLMQALLGKLNITEYSLLGSDSGGIIARYLAIFGKSDVQKLVLFNTEIPHHRAPYQRLYKFLASWLPGYNAMARMQLGFDAYLSSKQGFGGTLYNRQHLLGSFNHRFIMPLVQSRRRMEEATCCFVAVLNWRQLDQLHELHQEIHAPTLFIWGRQDNTFPESRAVEMSKSFKNVVDFASIDKAKLYVHEDQPKEVGRRLAAFL